MNTKILSATVDGVEAAANFLIQGEVVGLPTETVYGLAGNATNAESVLKIFTAKERPSFDPLIVHVSEDILKHPEGPLKALEEQGVISPEVLSWKFKNSIEAAMKSFWPGPLTFVLPRGLKIPDVVTSGQNTVGIRMPAHPWFQAVLKKIQFPLAAPSANRFGRISPTTADHVMNELNGRIAAVLDGGRCEIGVESTIISVRSPLQVSLLRPGKISIEEIGKTFGLEIEKTVTLGQHNQVQLAPGMLDQHYAPRKPLLLLSEPFQDLARILQAIRESKLEGTPAFLSQGPLSEELQQGLTGKISILSLVGSREEAAHRLFSEMRTLDQEPTIDFIVADIPAQPNSGISAAIADRLNRASFNKPLKK